jgi:hypothetical protein
MPLHYKIVGYLNLYYRVLYKTVRLLYQGFGQIPEKTQDNKHLYQLKICTGQLKENNEKLISEQM